jgi:hypothetical protein
MASLADIPPAFMSAEFKLQLIEWLRLLPIPLDQRANLLTMWKQQFFVTTTAADYARLDDTH